MFRILSLFIIICFSFNTYSQNCYYPTVKKVLLVGDSWGNFMWVYRSYKNSFDKFGYPDYIEEGAGTVENGAEAEDFLVNPKLANVINALNNNIDIDMVLISLGGNDILGDWHKNFSQQQNDSLLDVIQNRLNFIIDTIKQTKPNVQILMSGYDYPNFGETCFLVPTGAYADLFDDMGSPSFTEINGILTQLIQRFTLMAVSDPQLHVVNNLGLMQYVYGQSTSLIVPPYLPGFAPHSVTLPGGNINYPSPRAAMLANIDAFHLNQNAYQHFSDRQTELFFWQQFRRNKDTTFESLAGGLEATLVNNNLINGQISFGNISSASENSSIITFNTEDIPDNASITAATLFLTRNNVNNQNPILYYGTDKVLLDIISGYFGNDSLVEINDFTATADAYNIACLIGSAENNDYKVRFEINDTTYLKFINKTGLTQFRISMNAYDSLANNVITMCNAASAGHFKPLLDIKYDMGTPVNTELIQNSSLDIFIYPNPADDFISINKGDFLYLEIFNADGRFIELIKGSNFLTPISVNHLPTGFYMVKIIYEKGVIYKKLLVQH